MNSLVRFYFSLTPRLQAFITLRDGLQCLEYARQQNNPYSWLQAATDVQASLLGEYGRKPAILEVMALLKSIREHLDKLAQKHPSFSDQITENCKSITEHEQTIRQCMPTILAFLNKDGILNAWVNANKKQDFLGHKLNFPQALPIFWQTLNLQNTLSESLQELCAIVTHVDAMLNDFVPWSDKIAEEGRAQITPPRSDQHGLLIIGLDSKWVQQGITPEFSGNRLAIRMRFQTWIAAEPQTIVEEDIPYRMMLVPII
ncbi:MAG: hypothetical protein Q9M14_06725 [Mariprofundaceae bacterium]|nr:hypothetical protein [Mariprofundaceae bacterium]